MFELHGLKFGSPGSVSNGTTTYKIIKEHDLNIIIVDIMGKSICQLVLRIDDVVDMVGIDGLWLIPVGHKHPLLGHFCTSHDINFLIGLANQANHLNN